MSTNRISEESICDKIIDVTYSILGLPEGYLLKERMMEKKQ